MLALFSKILAESLLSLYPVFVKRIPVAFNLQMWSRFFAYVAISSLFIDYKFIAKTIFSKIGLLLAGVTLIHIYTSYKGFQLLESGPAYTLFYMYPVLILLMSGYTIPLLVGLVGVGGWLLARRVRSLYGVLMITLAAITEASIYFIVKRMKTPNSWNHVFLSYTAGAVLLTLLYFNQIKTIQLNDALTLSLGLNGILGLAGYVLRFYSMSRLSPFLYALLSNVGIVMSFVYGHFIGETVTRTDVVGALCIMVACAFAKQ
jgi:drug/metabolite transporter (DMT)-like permease